MRLLFYEMKKSWLRLPILVLAAVFCILNSYKINESYNMTGRFPLPNGIELKNAYYQLLDSTFSGKITTEKIEYAVNNYNDLSMEIKDGSYSTEYDESRLTGYVYGDYALYHAYIIPEMEYAVTYTNISSEIAKRAYDNIAFFTKYGNFSDAEKNQIIYRIYKNRQISNYNMTEWVSVYFKYDFSSLLVIIMIIIGLANSFSAESESGMYMIILTNRKNKKTAIAKLLSAALYVLLLTVLFTLADIVTINKLCRIEGVLNPIYSAQVFEYSPFDFSFLSAIVICSFSKYLAFTVVAKIVMIISAIEKNTILSIGTAFVLCSGLIIAANRSDMPANPINLLTGYDLLNEFDCVTLFNRTVLTLYVVMIAYIVVIAFLWIATIRLFMCSGRIKSVLIRIKEAAD